MAPVKYEAGSNRESIQWMFAVRREGGRGESENRGGSISSCCLPAGLLTPKNAAPGNQTFPSSAWDLDGCGAQYGSTQARAQAAVGYSVTVLHHCWVRLYHWITLLARGGWRSPVSTLNVVLLPRRGGEGEEGIIWGLTLAGWQSPQLQPWAGEIRDSSDSETVQP